MKPLVTLILLILIGCNIPAENKKNNELEPGKNIIDVKINSEQFSQLKSKIEVDSIFKNLDSLKTLKYSNFSNKQVFSYFVEKSNNFNELFCFNNTNINYSESFDKMFKIPTILYKKIFPNFNETTAKQKYEKLFAAFEKRDYYELILANKGKYFPQVYLLTFSKSDFKIVEKKTNIQIFC